MRDKVPCFAPIFGWEERSAIMQHVATAGYLTAGKEVMRFEHEFAKRLSRPYGVMVNSGSSALFVAMVVMDWKAGDRIIIPACNFPAAVSVCQWLKLIPVFVDCNLGTYNTDAQRIEDAIRKVGGVQGAVLVHNLGNPLDEDVWECVGDSIEDSSDALGSRIGNRMCGSYGVVSTHSFYPAHGICTLEGGACVTRNSDLHKKMNSIVSWGRDCTCDPGEDSRCGKRFEYDVDGVPYDHRYITSVAGGNFKVLELQGILGNLQLSKLDSFTTARKRNFGIIYKALEDIQDRIILPVSNGTPAWFGFPITLKQGDRMDITKRIEARGVQTRMLFAGNVTRHPFMQGADCYIPYPLENSDTVMEKTIIVGCGQSITPEEAEYVGRIVREEITK